MSGFVVPPIRRRSYQQKRPNYAFNIIAPIDAKSILNTSSYRLEAPTELKEFLPVALDPYSGLEVDPYAFDFDDDDEE